MMEYAMGCACGAVATVGALWVAVNLWPRIHCRLYQWDMARRQRKVG